MTDFPVELMFETVDAGDWTALRRFYAKNCVYKRPGFPMIEGIDAILGFYKDIRPIRSGRHTLKHIVDGGPRLSAAGVFRGVLRSGAAIELEFMDLYLLDNNLIRYRQTFFFTSLA
jgi:ketosteroid isomerase-like protein